MMRSRCQRHGDGLGERAREGFHRDGPSLEGKEMDETLKNPRAGDVADGARATATASNRGFGVAAASRRAARRRGATRAASRGVDGVATRARNPIVRARARRDFPRERDRKRRRRARTRSSRAPPPRPRGRTTETRGSVMRRRTILTTPEVNRAEHHAKRPEPGMGRPLNTGGRGRLEIFFSDRAV